MTNTTSSNKETTLQIAPHEGRELEYVANGIKPLALINRAKQPEQYGRAMDLQHVLVIRRQNNDEITITTKANEKLHDTYALLNSPQAAVIIRSVEDKHRMLGRLFGYSEEQIDAFIKADMKCACGNCTFTVNPNESFT